MAKNRTLLVTGASGRLGRRVVELLVDSRADRLVATTRYPDRLGDLAKRGVIVRRADFDDPRSLAAAFAGADRLLLVSTDAIDAPGRRIEQHRAAIDAARAVGAGHVIYTSFAEPDPRFMVAADHWATELAGRPVSYVPVEPAALKAALVAAGLRGHVADVLVSMHVAMAQGKFRAATSAVADLTGRVPMSVAAFLSSRSDLLPAAAAAR